MAKKALIVGIDYYQKYKNLSGAVNDAEAVASTLKRNGDRTKNFGIKLLTSSSEDDKLSSNTLRKHIKELFESKKETVLFYFAGHGHVENSGGFILASNNQKGHEGVSLNDVLIFANQSKATNKIIILDCCHSGITGSLRDFDDKALLAEGMTILTASSEEQYATEIDGSGVFTTLLVDALNGGAANLVGQITPGSVYAHIDQSLGEWDQRPIFKTNVQYFISLKNVKPTISLKNLKRIVKLFKTKTAEFQLDPSYEHTSKSMIPKHSKKFHVLQRYNRVNLVVPVNAIHMYDAAMESKSCKLTALGQHYWNLVNKGSI
ncbi:hypothetical protein IMCC3317_17940 [Kordia antarctica]|uniref:Peptidase C14 caspase domain-containing protein n=1 Tax=Kordia antarctica TaxID=1218801 RepID=A0A7L4ZIV5_9FLAO|nr:caspase family protein [Kordia antarctica]QHI36431.1 hypothetical protein IMCC3317_17940 [Kordia antarctica]